MILVSAGLIKKDKKILIAQRRAGGKQAGKWEFPGGKVEPAETPEECLVREVREELDMTIGISGFFGEKVHYYQDGGILLKVYWAQWLSGDPLLRVHDQVRWVDTTEIEDYDFAPADVFVVKSLCGQE